eukprot:m.106649 g.106649  ORF g.106649 m.106649 type:complete len:54 (-) comp21101_c0_seq2:139-300(-)
MSTGNAGGTPTVIVETKVVPGDGGGTMIEARPWRQTLHSTGPNSMQHRTATLP